MWVILAYLIAATVLVLMAGRLSDLFGRKRAYIGGFLLFSFASLGAGFASGATVLIVWRVLQGIAQRFCSPTPPPWSRTPSRARSWDWRWARTRWSRRSAWRSGRCSRRAGGISWHWVFWFNVPLGLAGAAWGGLILRELAKPDEVRGYDVLGNLTFVVGFTGLVLGVSRGEVLGLERSARDHRVDRRGAAAAPVGADREPLARADARPLAVSQSLSPPPPRPRSSTAWRASP